jgi:hypothetical protein
MNAALFDFAALRRCDHRRDDRDWLVAFRCAEASAELAAEAVRAACEAYRSNRCPETEAAYRDADRAYDTARLRFQVASHDIVGGVRAIAGIARHMQLASASDGRMI